MSEKTIRELGGEVWAEAKSQLTATGAPETSHQDLSRFIDVLMGVLARHEGVRIVNDEDLPVQPLDSPLG